MFLPYRKYLWNDQMACISLLSAHKIVNVFEDYKCVSKYMKNDETERGKKDEWVQCENTCCWWGWTMYNGCIVLLSLQCEHPLGGTQNKLQLFFFFSQNTREKLQSTAWAQGWLQSKLSFCFLKVLFQRKIKDFDICFCVKKWATVTKMNICGMFYFFFNYFKILK